jgi:hypothetical protein
VPVPEHFYLDIDLDRYKVVETSSRDPLQLLRPGGAKQIELQQLVEVLKAAKGDERVLAVLTHIGDSSSFAGPAQVSCSTGFRQTQGKPTL